MAVRVLLSTHWLGGCLLAGRAALLGRPQAVHWSPTTRPTTLATAAMSTTVVYRLAKSADWEAAKASGEDYKGAQLDFDSGFVHLSTGIQAQETAQLFFKGQADTMLLTVDVAKLPAGALKWEPVAHRSDLLPHLFAALPLAAVTEAVLMELNAAGEPIMPAGFYTPPPAPSKPAAGPGAHWRMDGQRVLVTGSTKGIGRTTAVELLELGASVFISSRSEADVTATVSELRATYGDERVHGCAADVSAAAGRQLLVAACATVWCGALDGLVNNVGTNQRCSIGEATPAQWETMLSTNMSSVFFLCQAFRPFLDRGTGKSVVNVSSAAGVRSTGTGAIYAMTKAAMNQLGRSLCCEWGGSSGIRVNTVAPWMVVTPMLQAAVAADPSQLEKVKAATPLGRLSESKDSASTICFLLMPAASYISGQTISVDGGLSAHGFNGPCVAT